MSNPQRRFPFVQLDVFHTQAFCGNPLAVFPDATGLSDGEMQAIAREMNLSESTFIFPRDPEIENEHGVRVRIFTVQEELPFAGHPTLGTAFYLHNLRGSKNIALHLNVGKIPVRFESQPGQPTFGEMTQRDPEFGIRHDHDLVARAAGINIEDIDRSLPIQTISTGVPFTVVPLRSLSVIQNLSVNFKTIYEYLNKSDGKFFYFVSRETVDPNATLHARMIFYNGEDPATGSAAGCAAAWMVANGIAKADQRVLIEQGVEMQRPSRIFVRASRKDDIVVNVNVGGNVVEVARGEIYF